MTFFVDPRWMHLLLSMIRIAHVSPGSQVSYHRGYSLASHPGYSRPQGSVGYPHSSGSGGYPKPPGSGGYPQPPVSGGHPPSSDSSESSQSSESGESLQSSESCRHPQSSNFGTYRQPSNSNCKVHAREPWSYEGRNGPEGWSSRYLSCSGRMQSPIAMYHNTVVQNNRLRKLAMNGYEIPVSKGTIQNNGHSVTLTPEDRIQRTIFVNGTTYSLSEIHFHWGDSSKHGAEHIIDRINHTMEVHFVHNYGRKKIAVVGCFFQEQKRVNSALRPIGERLSEVTFKDEKTPLTSKLNLARLLPENPASYYRYAGSLTTPSCDEGVIWSLLITRTLPVGTEQMKQFRKLYSVRKSQANSDCMLVNNYRPVQPLNGRLVFRSL